MDRKWRFNRTALDTITPIQEFKAALPPRDADYELASVSDLYAVYTVLHIENRAIELQWSGQGRFYYFIAVQRYQRKGKAAVAVAAAPEGDEDPPEVAAAGGRLGGWARGVPGHAIPQLLYNTLSTTACWLWTSC